MAQPIGPAGAGWSAFFAAAATVTSTPSWRCSTPTSCSRADLAPGESVLLQGPAAVAGSAMMFATDDRRQTLPVLVNGDPGVVVIIDGEADSVLRFTVRDDRIVAIEGLSDPERLARLDLPGV